MKGYKAFNKDLVCRDMQYEVGQIYEMEENPVCCNRGYHFCKNIADVYKYYKMSDDTRICEVVALGEVVTDDEIKFCTNKIKIVREIKSKAIKHCNVNKTDVGYCNSGDWNSGNSNSGNSNSGDWNSGNSNSGYRNSGNSNSGYRNSGNSNSGDWNSGNSNSGDWNSGNSNSGYRNSGYRNSGNSNSGNSNSGNSNSGDWNSGYRNSGNSNSGNSNSGNSNSGYCNSGNSNSGNSNSGDWNSGDWNSGNSNSGDWNSGNSNSGDWNSGNSNSGVFNISKNPTIKMFDCDSNWTIKDWINSDARSILAGCPYTYSNFVYEKNMTDEEKAKHPEYKTIGGYVKTFVVTKEDKQKWWNSLSDADKQKCYNLPNFNADKFVECLGIEHI